MKNERTVYTARGCFPFILFSSCNRKNENGYNGSYFYFSFFVWGLEKRKRMLSYPFSIFYYEIEKRKTNGRYIHGPRQIQNSNIPFKYQVNLPWNTPVGLPKAFQRKTNWKYWIKYIKPIWCPQQSDLPNITRLISLHYVPTPLLFPFNNCIWILSLRHTT